LKHKVNPFHILMYYHHKQHMFQIYPLLLYLE